MIILFSDALTILFINYFLWKLTRNVNFSNFKLFLVIISEILLVFLGNHEGISHIGKLYSFIIIYFYSMFLFRDSILKKTLLFLLCYVIIGFTESLSILFLKTFNINIALINIYSHNIYFYIILLTQTLSYLLAFLMIRIKKTISNSSLPKSFYALFLPALLLLLFLFIYGNYQTLFQKQSYLLIMFFFLLIANGITILFQLQIIKTSNLQKDLEISRLNQQLMTSKYNELNKEYKTNFEFLHDLLHTCSTLNELAESKNYYDLNIEIKKLSETTFKEFNSIFTNSPIFSSVLNHKRELLKSLNITVTSTFYNDNITSMNAVTQMKFYSNILDIPITYLQKSDQNFIIIKSRKELNSTIFQMIFSLPGNNIEKISLDLEKIDKDFKTTSSYIIDSNLNIIDILILINN